MFLILICVSYIADVVKDATGVDMIEQTLNLYLGKKIIKKELIKTKNINCLSLRLGSSKTGYLKSIKFSDELKKYIYKKYLKNNTNSFVNKFTLGKNSLGNIFLKFRTLNQMVKIMKNINKYINIIVK